MLHNFRGYCIAWAHTVRLYSGVMQFDIRSGFLPATGGPLITALPDEDVSRPGGGIDTSSGKPIISSPTMVTTGTV